MKRTERSATAPFQPIVVASKITGLSQYFLRGGCKAGTIPHIKSGTVYLINIPRLLEQLDAGPVGAADPLQGRERGRACEF